MVISCEIHLTHQGLVSYITYEMTSCARSSIFIVTGIPEPPINVQVESGPQEGTLLLTWFPVTIDTSGFSNGALVTGYMVYADGQPAKEAKGATSMFYLDIY